jgi:hypothetical protein
MVYVKKVVNLDGRVTNVLKVLNNAYNIVMFYLLCRPHRWRNGYLACLECGRSWVRGRSGQTKDNKIGICCFSATHATLRRTNKDRLARNHNNVSEWSDMPTRRLLIQWTRTIKIHLGGLVSNKAGPIIISLIVNLFSPWHSWNKCAELALDNNYSTHYLLNKRCCKNINIRN